MKYIYLLITLIINLIIGNHADPLVFTRNNLISINGEINRLSASKFISDILSTNEPIIYVYLNTPGGSVISGYEIIETIDMVASTGKNIICVANHAASMGFVILQSCPTRYVRPNSVIMQHQMSIGVEGPIEQANSRLDLARKLEKNLLERQAKRIGISKDDFRQRCMNDWFLFGEDAVAQNVADAVVHVTCNADLISGRHNQTISFLFFSVQAEYSDCPLISEPLRIFDDNSFKTDELERFKMF